MVWRVSFYLLRLDFIFDSFIAGIQLEIRQNYLESFQMERASLRSYIFYMESFKILLLAVCAMHLVACEIQTGYVDVNRQLGGLELVNDHSNTLCYTHLFGRSFKTSPQIATSVVEFATDSESQFQLQIRIRKLELSPTEVKFMVFARKEISIWSNIVFAYMATDRDNIAAAVLTLETQDLSGCGNILQQIFTIEFPVSLVQAKIVAFLNGFDVAAQSLGTTGSLFEVSIEIVEQKSDHFVLAVSRISPTQIYSVSVSYVVVSDSNTEGYIFDVITGSESLTNIQKQSPMITFKEHKSSLQDSNFIIGFSKFMFKSSDQKSLKSLALSMDKTLINLGSLDSTNLQLVEYSFMIIKETIQCQLGEIIVLDEAKGSLECKMCSIDSFKIPNKELNTCVCQSGFQEINSKCYQIPAGGGWSESLNTFYCDKDHSMVHHKQSDEYKCELTPRNKMYNTEQGKWECISGYFEQDNDCYSIPEHGSYDAKTKKISCDQGFSYANGFCLKAGENFVYSSIDKKFICKTDYFEVGGACLKPFKHSFYSSQTKSFQCQKGFYSKQTGVCESIPNNMKLNPTSKKLECIETYFDIEGQGCLQKPELMIYDSTAKRFRCIEGHFIIKGNCLKPAANEEYSEKLQEFICVSGTYRVGLNCLKPKPHSYFSEISGKFECSEGYFDIEGDCQAAPENMKYSEVSKKFVCISGFQQVNSQCLLIPLNKVWSSKTLRFECKPDYFQMKDGGCQKPGKNENYDVSSLKFICLPGFYREKGVCIILPANSIPSENGESFICFDHFFRKDSNCQKCSDSCLTCSDEATCTSCRPGFGVSSGSCKQICGDGIRISDACDDGNLISQDGCSDKCEIEDDWKCEGGSPYGKDVCTKIPKSAIAREIESHAPISMKLVGMSHLFGKIILNVRFNYMPRELIDSPKERDNIFKVLSNSNIPLSVASSYIETTSYTYVVVYDFRRVEPIPEFLTRVEINPEVKDKYFPNVVVTPLFVRVNPAFMARLDDQKDVL